MYSTYCSGAGNEGLSAAQIRLYRVRWFFEHLEYNLTLSLLWVTLVRNLVVSPDMYPHTPMALSHRMYRAAFL